MIYIVILLVLVIAVGSFPKGKDNSHQAKFASASSVMSIFNFGYSLVGGLKATTRDVAYMNSLVVGPSGSGKSSTVLLGSVFTLARGGASLAIMDVSSELYKLTSGYLSRLGYKVYCIDFGKNSDLFNPLLLCSTITDVQKIAFLLIKNSGIETKSDPFWSKSSEMLLSLFMEYLVFHSPKELCSMANLVRLIDVFAGDPKKIDILFVRTKNEDLLTRYKAMVKSPEKTLQSTLATVRAAIKVFCSPAVRNCTALNTIDFSDFRKEKSVLYICVPINDINFYAPLSALLFEALFKEMMSEIPKDDEKDIFCLLDEMVLMRFENLGSVFSNCRKYRMGCLGVTQDERMLEMAYSPAESHAIRTNAYSKVYLPGQPLQTCKTLEETLGKFTYTDEHGSERTRQLMTAAEIRMCEDALLLCGNKPPIRATLRPYYNHYIFNKRTKIPPYDRSHARVNTEPPLISFNEP